MHSKAEELSRLLERYRMSTDEDILTGLLNRRTFFKLAMSELRRAKESYQDSHSALCLALADLDNFKNVNDHFGHANGDRVLQLFACRLREACRADDISSVSGLTGASSPRSTPSTSICVTTTAANWRNVR